MASVSTLARSSGTTVPAWRPPGKDGMSADGPARAHRVAVPLVEVLHAVFHRALVRADFVLAALHQRQPAGVHAQRDLVVLDTGFHVRGLLGLDEPTLERS